MMTHLRAQGHDILGVSYDRGFRNLKDDFDMFDVPGLHIVAIQNRVSKLQTAIKNLKSLTGGISKFREFKETVFNRFQPDIVLCDFEPLTAYMATHRDLPLVSIDNQHRMRYMEYPCPAPLRKDALVAETVIRAFVPQNRMSPLVTTFFFGDVKNDRTLLFPPILRHAVFDAKPSDEGHILVYFTQEFESFMGMPGNSRANDFSSMARDGKGRRATYISAIQPRRIPRGFGLVQSGDFHCGLHADDRGAAFAQTDAGLADGRPVRAGVERAPARRSQLRQKRSHGGQRIDR